MSQLKNIVRSFLLAALLVSAVVSQSAALAAEQSQGSADQDQKGKKGKADPSPQKVTQKTVSAEIKRVFTEMPKGESFRWMKMLFGDWIKGIWTNDTATPGKGKAKNYTLVTVVGSYANILALVFAVIMITYSTLAAIANSANDGEVLGRQWSTMWLPTRTFLSLGLLMPAPIANGYPSIIQVVFIYIAGVSIQIADGAWELAAEELTSGAPIVQSTPVINPTQSRELLELAICTESVHQDHIRMAQEKRKQEEEEASAKEAESKNEETSEPDFIERAKDLASEVIENNAILAAAATTVGVVVGAPFVGVAAGGVLLYRYFNPADKLGPQVAYTVHYVELSGEEKTHQSMTSSFKNIIQPGRYITEISLGEHGECGNIQFAGSSYYSDENQYDYKNSIYRKAAPVFQKVVIDHYELLRTTLLNLLLNKASEGGLIGGYKLYAEEDDNKKRLESLLLVAVNYKILIDSFITGSIDAVSGSIQKSEASKKFRESMIADGWGLAGAWFHKISRYQDLGNEILSTLVVEVKEPEICPQSWTDDLSKFIRGNNNPCVASYDLRDDKKLASLAYKTVYLLDDKPHDAYGLTELGANCTKDSCDDVENSISSTSIASGFGRTVMNFLTGDASSDTSGRSNPFAMLTSLGNTFVAVGVSMWLIIEIALSFTAVGTAATSFLTGDSAFHLVTSIMMAPKGLVMLFVSMGYMLAYVIPFMPIMIWVAVIVGWLFLLVEGFIASPLAVALMAAPEGEGIMGTRLERAMAMYAATLMKPTLSIIGLIASISLAYIGFAVLNKIFNMALGDVFVSGAIGLYTGGPQIVMAMMLYVGAAVAIAKMCFKVIYMLPERVLEWFSSSYTMRQFSESDMESTSEQVAQQAAKISETTQDQQGKAMRKKHGPQTEVR